MISNWFKFNWIASAMQVASVACAMPTSPTLSALSRENYSIAVDPVDRDFAQLPILKSKRSAQNNKETFKNFLEFLNIRRRTRAKPLVCRASMQVSWCKSDSIDINIVIFTNSKRFPKSLTDYYTVWVHTTQCISIQTVLSGRASRAGIPHYSLKPDKPDNQGIWRIEHVIVQNKKTWS